MLKHSVKVIFLTILIAFMVVCFGFMALASFFPKKMSQFYTTIGLNGRAYAYADKAYEQDESVENANDLMNIAIKCKDDEKIYFALNQLIEHKDFNAYVKSLPNGSTYYDYVTSEYVKNNYRLKKLDNVALCKLASVYSKPEYRHANALESLISVGAENKDIELLNEILKTLEDFSSSGTCVKTSVNRLNRDIFNLEELILRISENEKTVL